MITLFLRGGLLETIQFLLIKIICYNMLDIFTFFINKLKLFFIKLILFFIKFYKQQ